MKDKTSLTIIGGCLVASLILGSKCYELDKQEKELTAKYYRKYAQELIEESTYNNVAYLYDDSYYSTLDEDNEVTTGEYLSEYLVSSGLKCLKLNDDFYTSDGRKLYVYVIDNHYLILDEDEFDYYNGVCRYIDTHTYEDLKDYSVYLDVEKEDSVIEDGTTYYRTTRKLIKK